MKDLSGKVAVVTGGAAGIGRATGALLAAQGMKVVLADIEREPLDAATGELRDAGLEVTGVVTDVARFDSMSQLRDEILSTYGKLHVAFLNAGVSAFPQGRMWEADLKDWEWGMAVNVWGVIHGIKALVPPIVDQGEGGHVVITSSSVGVIGPVPSNAIYNVTKAADLGLAESLHGQLRGIDPSLSASVLVPPGTINTGLFSSGRNRQPEYAPSVPREEPPPITYEKLLERMNRSGNPRRPVQPEEVAEYVLDALRNDTFWIFPDERHADIQQNFDTIIRARADSMLGRTDPLIYMQKPTS